MPYIIRHVHGSYWGLNREWGARRSAKVYNAADEAKFICDCHLAAGTSTAVHFVSDAEAHLIKLRGNTVL